MPALPAFPVLTHMLRYNLAANCVGQVTSIVLGIVTVPIYVRYLGIEAYGLITFNVVLLGWMQVLDMGLTPTLCREMAGLEGAVGEPRRRPVAGVVGEGHLWRFTHFDHSGICWLHANRRAMVQP